MIDTSANKSELVLSGVFDGYEQSEMFAMWVVPDFLERWWPEFATVKSGLGGNYHFTWPERGWVLDGEYTAWIPGLELGFTWCWTHDPSTSTKLNVFVRFTSADNGGTCVTIRQGTYSDSESDQIAREGHKEGWMHFCMRLAGLRPGELSHNEPACPEVV